MLCLINITDNKLANWMFGRNLQELVRKAEHQLFIEESPEKQTELKEVIDKLSKLVYPDCGKRRLTNHYYMIVDALD